MKPRRPAPRRRRQDSGAAAAAGIAFRRSQPDGGAKLDEASHVGTRFLAHEVGEPPRHLAFVGLRKGPEQHVRDDQAEHVIAEKFETLVAAGAISRPAQCGDVSERLLEQRRILEAVTDALLELRSGPASAGARSFRPSRPLPRRRHEQQLQLATVRMLARKPELACLVAYGSSHDRDNRLHRTGHGQRQIAHARSSS